METSPQLAPLLRRMSQDDPSKLPTPTACTADFCVIPIGTPSASVSKEVAEVQKLLKKSGLKYHMHAGGTSLEGSWDQVTRVIGQCHSMLHANGLVRVHSDIRIGSRTDKTQGIDDKVKAVEALLGNDGRINERQTPQTGERS